MPATRIRFLREYRGRKPGVLASVADWGFGVCQALVHRGVAAWDPDSVEGVVGETPAVAPAAVQTVVKAEGDDRRGRRHRGA